MSASAVRIRARAIGTAAVECGSAIRQEAGKGTSVGTAWFPFRGSGSGAVARVGCGTLWRSRLLGFNLTNRNDTDKGLPTGIKGTLATGSSRSAYRVLVTEVTYE
ncbi:hypothetical protein GCM10009647_073040 [Streptomyces sanglieri]